MVITEVCGTSVFGSIPSQGTKKMSKENKLTPGLPQGFEDRWNKKLLLKIDTIFLVTVSQLILLLTFCQRRSDFYAAPLILIIFPLGS